MWPRRSWYPLLLELLVEVPVSLPERPDLLTQNKGRLWHPMPEAVLFTLTAWKLSGRLSLQSQVFVGLLGLERLLDCHWILTDEGAVN